MEKYNKLKELKGADPAIRGQHSGSAAIQRRPTRKRLLTLICACAEEC